MLGALRPVPALRPPWQADLTRVFRLAVRLVFNLLIVVILVALFIGVARVFLNLGQILTRASVPQGFNAIVSDVLSLLVLTELFRSFVEYFDHQRVKLHVLLDVGIVFALREFVIHLYTGALQSVAMLLAYGGVPLALAAARALAIRFVPDQPGAR